MSTPILATKLFIPSPSPNIVPRPLLIARLNDGLAQGSRLTLISAPAGFGKSTLVSEWIANCRCPVAWLSLDEGENDPARFIAYLVAALQKIKPGIGDGLQGVLKSPQPLQIENILTNLVNEIASIQDNFLIVLDDYHAIDSPQVDHTLVFLIDHQPPQMHLVIVTREDPDLPIARLRARGQCIEFRAADLQFTPAEAAEFLNQGMGLNLSDEDVAALETRTEGWIAGLQMAAISMKGIQDVEGFIQSFTGSHRFVMDYLLEEVLSQQPENIQLFLQKTSVLDRLCGSLCDALLLEPSFPGQSILEYLEHANLFIIPQDNERCWFRYHHLFASLLQKRLEQSLDQEGINRLHILASGWYEKNDMTLEAFHHAAAANDIERAINLMESNKMPLYLRGTATTLLDWLVTLPDSVLNAKPALWCKQAELLLLKGQVTGVQQKLEAAEAALATQTALTGNLDDPSRDIIGKIAAIRSNLAVAQQNAETILVQSHRALEYLLPGNFAYRSSVNRDIGFAYNLQGNRAEAARSFAEALSISEVSGDAVEPLLSIIGLAQINEIKNQLYLADEYYQRILPKICEYSMLNAGVVYIGMARIHYQWNNLDTAEKFVEKSLQLAQQFSQIPNRLISSELILAYLKLARGDLESSSTLLSQAEKIARQYHLMHRIPNVISARVMLLLRQDDLRMADQLSQQHDIPISRARVLLAQRSPSAALSLLESFRKQMELKDWQDELLKTIILQAVAFHMNSNDNKALECLSEALAFAEPNGFIRLFLDEGSPMADLLLTAASRGIHRDYATQLLAAFESEKIKKQPDPITFKSSIVEPLSPRELEILRLLAKGLSNRQICERLYLALDTVKGHNRKIFDKLNVKSRSEAIARALELDLL